MLVAVRLILNLLLALLVSLFGSYIVLSTRRRPNAWLWGAVFGAAICLTMIKNVSIQNGWLFDFRAVVVALGGFAGGLPTYLIAAAIGSLYRLYLGGAGAVPGVASLFAAGLVGVYFGRRNPVREAASIGSLLVLGAVLAVIFISFVWMGSLASGQGNVMTLPLALFLLGLMPLGTAICFRVFSAVYRRLTEQAMVEAAAASLPTALAVLDKEGRIVATNRAVPASELARLLRAAGDEPAQVDGRKYVTERRSFSTRGVERGELVTLDDVTLWHDATEQLRNFFELALDLMIIVGPNDEITHANRTAVQFGLRPQAGLLDLVHPEDCADTRAALQTARGGGEGNGSFEHGAVRADGCLRWLAWSCVAEFPSGNIYAVGRDVTEDRKHLETLRITTALLKEQSLFLELAHDAIIVRDLEGRIVFWNSGASRTYGYTREEALGALQHALLRGTYQLPIEQIEAELERNEEWHGEAKRLHRDGTSVIVACHMVLKRDEARFPVAVLEMSRSITEQVQARQATAHLAALIEQSQDAIISTDPFLRILTANNAAASLLGCTLPSLIGGSLLAFVPPEHRRSLKQELDHTFLERPSHEIYMNLCAATGSLVPVAMTFSLMPSQLGSSAGISLILRDLTAKHARDKEIARLDRLSLASQLASGIGHEVRNPLTTVRGFLQLFCLREDLASYKDQFALLIGALDRMNETITEFLTLARNHPVELTATDINAVVVATLGLIEADARQVSCVVRAQLQVVPSIAASERAIRQVLVNLVRNALEASTPGGVVTVSTEQVDGRVVLSVSDKGTGISATLRAQIGTPFFTTKPEGTGLGLTVCQAIALQHGATLTFDSGEGGTTFSMSFPSTH